MGDSTRLTFAIGGLADTGFCQVLLVTETVGLRPLQEANLTAVQSKAFTRPSMWLAGLVVYVVITMWSGRTPPGVSYSCDLNEAFQLAANCEISCVNPVAATRHYCNSQSA